MRINFAMWDTARSGGSRHIFELANRLTRRGHKVTVTSLGAPNHRWFPVMKEINLIYPEKKLSFRVPKKGKLHISYIIDKLLKRRGSSYGIDRTRVLAKAIPDTDANFATSYPTAYSVFLSGKGKMFYYVQHHEAIFPSNAMESRYAEQTYYLPLRQFVVSRWLQNLMQKKAGKKPIYAGSGIENDIFKPSDVEKEENTVMCYIRGAVWKGDEDMLQAFNIVQKKIKGVKFRLISNQPIFDKLTKKLGINLKNIEIVKKPSDEALVDCYTSSTVFLLGSHLEGFGEPPLEAMACGTSVVTTDCLGVRDYVRNNKNALMVPPKKPEAMATAIIKLLKNPKLRSKLIRRGFITAKNNSWEKIVDRVERALLKEVKVKK